MVTADARSMAKRHSDEYVGTYGRIYQNKSYAQSLISRILRVESLRK